MLSLPVVSFSDIYLKKSKAIKNLKNILHDVGFFYLVDHGIENQKIQEIFI